MNNFNPDVILKIILDKNFQSSGDDPVVCTKRVSGRSCLFKFFSPDNTCKYIKIFASSNNEPLIYRLLKDHPLYIDVIHSVGTIEDVHYVILNDISTKATNLTSWKNPVDDGKMKKILSAVAEFHSLLYNRNDNLLSAIGKPWHLQSEMNYLRHLEHLKRDFEKFIADMPLPVDTTVQSFFTESLEYLNFNRMRIFDDSRNKLLFTFIHGDLNAGNIYYPKGLISSVQILDL